ncbi:MAG TPA: alpha-L-fucosidase, partial [Limnochordia bacterium]
MPDEPVYAIQEGPFEPTWESLRTFECPAWFRDAKFGIWAHWGPQCVPMVGDWYARKMYEPQDAIYHHHWRTYGHPSRFGYKDILRMWKAERFDPEGLMDLYAAAGAKYFVAQACHHDNFDNWDSRHHRWNAVRMGPQKDIVGLWRAAAERRGLRFGVSEHLGAGFSWSRANKGSDADGPYAGIP